MNADTPEAQALIHEQTATFVRLCEAAADAAWSLIDNAPNGILRTRAYEITEQINQLALEAMGTK